MSDNYNPFSPLGYGYGSQTSEPVETTPEAILKSAEQALAEGRLDEAERLASDVLASGSDVLVSGHENARAYHVKGVATLARGQVQDAIELLAKSRELDPSEPLVQMRLGVAHAMAGSFEDSLLVLREAAGLAPNLGEVHVNLGVTLLKLERWTEAEEAFRTAVALQMDTAQAFDGLGTALVALERHEEGIEVLQKAISLSPGQASAHANIAEAYMELGCTDEGLDALRTAAKLSPENRYILSNLASACLNTHSLDEAMAVYDRLLQVAPNWPSGLASYANALEKQNRPADARTYAEQALQLDSDNAVAGLTLVRLHLRDGESQQAVDLAQKLLARNDIPRETQQHLYFELGRGLERIDRCDEAFESFSSCQNLMAQAPATQNTDKNRYPEMTERCRSWFRGARTEGWPRKFDDALTAPVFFVGFPRSGTTLMERMLRSHPALVTGDEFPWLANVAAKLPADYPKGCGSLSESQILELRKEYFDIVRSDLAEDLEGRRLVDKLALNTVYIGLMRRIFPESKVLFSVRDPRDVVLSCFSQPLGHDTNAPFLDIETTARFYAQVMDLWFQFRDTLGLETMTYRYEDLTRDPEGVARKILAFLEVDWDPNVLKHHERMEGVYVRTASRESVSHAIHEKAVFRWRKYESHLAPVQSILAPFVEAAGYEPSS